ncbi:DNase I-like protein, partial [Jaminaea rosea]
QRPAIKVKIITWNMGGASLPKGDLEVLLGRVGGYVPPEEDWDLDDAEGKGIPGQEGTPRHERIPPLPHDDGHPYHLLVVAGQECPWGDGKRIATGIGVAGELSDLTRSKSKATHLSKSKEKSGEGHNGAAVPQTPAGFGTGADTPAGGSDGFPFGSPPPTAGPGGNVPAGAPATHGGGRVFGGKGWSDMCEDWLCRGPAAQSKATKGLAATTEALVSGHIGPSQEGSRNPSRAPSPCPSSHEIDGTPLSLGAYELLVKERCAMIYMAVYCWRGCRDRVRGFDRAHVKSGLLAGRVGNKGAVGISVKLGQTRMLFVNSHLAAHEGKIQTRLDNIAKIKKELRLDTFLPTEDPTNKLADVTGMYDHSFWCGDLNFRVDITRQHADWLIMNKRYDQALEFDQLRKVMKEGREFQNFREHDISFPPTYKYDVLKTLKKPKRDRTVRRILRRRGHTASSAVAATFAGNETDEDPDETRATAADADETMDTNRSGATKRASMISLQDGEDETDDDDDASSTSSIGPWGGSVGSSGFTGPPSESEHSGPSDSSGKIGVATAAAGTKEKTPAAASESQPYDTSAKQRVPSWTDRILWRTNVKPKVVGPTLATIGERGEQQAREPWMRPRRTFSADHDISGLPPEPRRGTARSDHVAPPLPTMQPDAHSVAMSTAAPPLPESELEIIGPRRGEVECLLYKSLDDGEMRALEGRSDHRPVIFVGSIGI